MKFCWRVRSATESVYSGAKDGVTLLFSFFVPFDAGLISSSKSRPISAAREEEGAARRESDDEGETQTRVRPCRRIRGADFNQSMAHAN